MTTSEFWPVVGDPAQCIEGIAELKDRAEATHLFVHSRAGLPENERLQSLQLFADRVLPSI